MTENLKKIKEFLFFFNTVKKSIIILIITIMLNLVRYIHLLKCKKTNNFVTFV